MPHFPSFRFLFMALLLAILPPASAHAGIFISVGIAPPPLPVYVQPPCPEPNMLWAPGYWAYDYDLGQYYWVPGAWVPAPYEGALWTPPYWGWNDGAYLFHAGYWGPEVGYYGGVNYGFGYMGIGFVGGEWHRRHFFYNTAVINVNRTYIHNTFINNTIVHEHTIVNNNHIAYSGGPRGIEHMPTPQERHAMQLPHVAPTHYQEQHIQQARSNRQNFFNANHGRPQTVALARPLPAEHVQAPANFNNTRRPNQTDLPRNGGFHGSTPSAGTHPMQPLNPQQSRPRNSLQPNLRQNENARIGAAPLNQQQRGFGNLPQNQQQRTVQQQRSLNAYQPGNNRPQSQQLYRPNMQQPQQPAYRPQPQQPAARQQYRPQPQPYRPQPQPQSQPRFDSQSRIQPIPAYRPAPQQYHPQAQQQYRPQPQQQYHPQPQQQYRPQPQQQYHPQPQPQYRPQPQQQPHPQPQRAPESRPAPQPRTESRPHR